MIYLSFDLISGRIISETETEQPFNESRGTLLANVEAGIGRTHMVLNGLIVLNLEIARETAWFRIKAARDEAQGGNFTCNGDVYQTNLELIPGAMSLAFMAKISGGTFLKEWTLADNTRRTLDADAMIAVGVAQGEYVGSIRSIGDTLRDAIWVSTTIEELDMIVWPTSS